MRVLYLTNIPSPYRVDFFNELGRLCKLTVIFERKSAKSRNSDWLKGRINDFTAVFLHGINIGDASALCVGVLKHLSKDLYDEIIVGGFSTPTGMLAIEYLLRKKIPFYLNADGGFVNNERNAKFALKRHFIGSASKWLSTGEATDTYLTHYGASADKISRYKFTSLHDEDIVKEPFTDIEKKMAKEKLKIAESEVILSVGRYIYSKGYDVLIRASKHLKGSVGVYIIGGTPTPEFLEIKEKLSLENVHFIEHLPKSRLREWYCAADLFVLPTRSDVWGLVINEAMAMGLPIITTQKCVAGLELIEDGENGFLVEVDNEEMLAKKINLTLADSVLLHKMSSNNIRKIRSYTIENMAQTHFEILNLKSVSVLH